MARPVRQRRLVRGEPVVGTVRTTHKRRGEVVADNQTDRAEGRKRMVPEVYGRVGVRGSSTVNMGDFNSVQVSVYVELPSAPGDEAMRKTYRRASDLVEEWIQEQLDAAIADAEDAI
jgi:hypothetical protein